MHNFTQVSGSLTFHIILFGVVHGVWRFRERNGEGASNFMQILGKDQCDTVNDYASVQGKKHEYTRLKADWPSTDNDKHIERPMSSTMPNMSKFNSSFVRIDVEPFITCNVADEVGTGYGIYQQILSVKLGVHSVVAKLVSDPDS